MFDNKKYKSINKRIIKEYNLIREKNKRSLLCHAPFSTLFFTEYGEILPCYYNKNIVFGNYPDNTPEEAWFGKKMNTIREHIKHNDLSYGCQDCQLYLKLGNYYSVGAWKYDYLPVNKGKYPISIDFQISNICNLACIMCNGEYSMTVRQKREKKKEYTNPYDDSFIKKIENFIPHLKEAAFTGGEVFLIKQYFDIWDKIAEINPSVRISITTNGTILNELVKSYLEKLDLNITISLDSVHKENFENIRRFSNFEKVMENLYFYTEYTRRKGTLLTVKICPLRQNWHELPEIIDFLNKKNISFLFNNVIFPPYCSLWNLPSNELNKIAAYLENQSYITENSNRKKNIDRVYNLINQIKNWEKKSKELEKIYPNLKLKSVSELYDLIISSIRAYLLKNPCISENTEYGRQIEEVFNKLITQIKNENILKNAFIYYFQMPVQRLLGEFNIRNIEKIIERTIQAGCTEPPEIK